MRYHVTLTTSEGQELTAAIKDSDTLDSTLRWIERLRLGGSGDPILPWLTLEGYHWCLIPAELVGEVQVRELQPVELANS